MLLLGLSIVRRRLWILLIGLSSALIGTCGRIRILILALRCCRHGRSHQIDILLVFRHEIVIESDGDSFLRFRLERHSHQKAKNENEKKIDGFFGYFEFRHIVFLVF